MADGNGKLSQATEARDTCHILLYHLDGSVRQREPPDALESVAAGFEDEVVRSGKPHREPRSVPRDGMAPVDLEMVPLVEDCASLFVGEAAGQGED